VSCLFLLGKMTNIAELLGKRAKYLQQ